MGIKSRIYLEETAPNKARRFGELNQYNLVVVVNRHGKEVPGMITRNEIETFVSRAARNPEDVPGQKSFFRRLLGI